MKTTSFIATTCIVLAVLTRPCVAQQVADTTATHGARGLVQRLLPGHIDRFVFEAIPAVDGKDVFELESRDGRIVIRGNTGVAMATGLNWYLRYYCLCHVSWCGTQLNLPDPLPEVPAVVRRQCWAKNRYFLNYCCFGYSLPWWNWKQWEKLIDWMALNGINTPLAVTGVEAVWQAVCQELGFNKAQINQFLAGPPYLPFSWMGCLDGWGGPLPQSWIDGHEALQKKILTRQRELGMRPILQGFTGHVPAAVGEKFPEAKLHRIRWIEWQTHLLDPFDPLYPRIARLFMEQQTARFGTDHLYAADTFIEMTPPSGDPKFLEALSRAIYEGMATTDTQATWVLQTWMFNYQRSYWTLDRIRAFLAGVPDNRLFALDLYCETAPQWKRTQGFFGKPWAWCNVQNFGCAIHLSGALNTINSDIPAARKDPQGGGIIGLGFVNEGLGYNPVVYDLMYEMAWRDRPVDLDDWIRHYSRQRYGRANAAAEKAWLILEDTVYNGIYRGHSVLVRAPALGRPAAIPRYDSVRLSRAWQHLQEAATAFADVDTYQFDLVNVGRQVLSNYAAILHGDLCEAYQSKDLIAFENASRRFLQLIRDLDALLATRREFLLGRWLEDAKSWGKTESETARFEWNARRVLTLWGEGRAIDDYAAKEWSGMLGGYYLKRWKWFLEEVAASLKSGQPFDGQKFNQQLRQWMVNWSDQREIYPTSPRGESVAMAKELWGKYSTVFKPEAVSLTTGKPVTCSFALPPYPAHLANDGWKRMVDRYWASDVTKDSAAWWQVDLEEPTTVGRVVIVGFYGDRRYYGFTVEASLDGTTWDMIADRRDNKELATITGYTCRFEPRAVRYLRVTMTHNSANTGRHLVEVMAYGK